MGIGLSFVFCSLTWPEIQKPSRSFLMWTSVFVLWAGPKGDSGMVPSQCQVPTKLAICSSSAAGLGGGGGAVGACANVAVEPARRTARTRRVCIEPPLTVDDSGCVSGAAYHRGVRPLI